MTNLSLWEACLAILKTSLSSSELSIWIYSLQPEEDGSKLTLFAPNEYVRDYVAENFLGKINKILERIHGKDVTVTIKTGSREDEFDGSYSNVKKLHKTNLRSKFTFCNFVEGASNKLACAAAKQVSENLGESYNPYIVYGCPGLGKTHLLYAIGNYVIKKNREAKVFYCPAEQFVHDMVEALRTNSMHKFKSFYRSLSLLLLDDFQFLAWKVRSGEEFLHTINSMLNEHKQLVIASDRYPKGIEGVKDPLKSRLGWGLTVGIDPPEFETRVAILISKSSEAGIELSEEVAFFIAQHVRSNVRELEGALKRVSASAFFTGRKITLDLARESLRDLLELHAKLVTVENIQKIVSDFYKIKLSDLLSKKRNKVFVRPRQIAMALSKELTDKSLPEIGVFFGGKDHTTVLHACRQVKGFLVSDHDLSVEYKRLKAMILA